MVLIGQQNLKNDKKYNQKNSNDKAKNIPRFTLFSPETKPEKAEKKVPKMNLNNEDNSMTEDKAKYENYIYKKSEGNKLKKYYLVLIDKDIYYYKSDQKKEVLGMHNLSGCFFKENSSERINEKIYYCFSIVFPKKERKYYVGSSEIYENFIKALNKILDDIFISAAPIKGIARTREKVFKEVFGNTKGYSTVDNEVKIISHGFDPKESFRKVKKKKK